MLRDEHADVIRESVRTIARELMEADVSQLIGAELGERRPEDRATHRNGYRSRRWDTRAGEIELQIPKLRQGSYFPSFLQPRKRATAPARRRCRPTWARCRSRRRATARARLRPSWSASA